MKVLQQFIMLTFIILPFLLFSQNHGPSCPFDESIYTELGCPEQCFEHVSVFTGKVTCCCDLVIGIPRNDCSAKGIFETTAVIGTIDPCSGKHCQLFQVGPFWASVATNKNYEIRKTTISKDKPKIYDKPIVIKDPKVIDYIQNLYYRIEASGNRPPKRK